MRPHLSSAVFAWLALTLAAGAAGAQGNDAAAPADAASATAAAPATPASATPPTAETPAKAERPVRPTALRPLWELGLGFTGLSLPDYRGAHQRHAYVLPYPYLVYRGEYLRSDREGMRAMLFDSERVKFDLSFGAAAPSRSNTSTREGMPELPGNVEVGPSLNITLDEEVRRRWRLDLRLPVRAVMTLESSPRYVGATFSPNLNLDLRMPTHGWNIGALTGPLFATRAYHAQYYQVDPAYARADRPAYQARGGYAGWQTIVSTSKRFGDTWFGAFLRHESLQGAVYADSPMVKRNSSLTAGFGMAWVFAVSPTLVESTN